MKVIWSEAARADLVEITLYIAEDNPFAADRVIDAIEHIGNKLATFPAGRKGRVERTYEKVVTGLPYILSYALSVEPNGTEIIAILRVIHTARDWPSEAWPSEV